MGRTCFGYLSEYGVRGCDLDLGLRGGSISMPPVSLSRPPRGTMRPTLQRAHEDRWSKRVLSGGGIFKKRKGVFYRF